MSGIGVVIDDRQDRSVRDISAIGILDLGKRPLGTWQRSMRRVVLLHLGPRHRTGNLGVGDGAPRTGNLVAVCAHVAHKVEFIARVEHLRGIDRIGKLVALRRLSLANVVREVVFVIRVANIGLLVQVVELNGANGRIGVILAVIHNGDDTFLILPCIVLSRVDGPLGTRERFVVRRIDLAPRNGGAAGRVGTGPREVVTLLVHVDDGSRVTLTKLCGNLRAVH